MVDADLLCDRVAFISNGNLVALDTPKRLKEKNSNHRVVIHYLCASPWSRRTPAFSESPA